MLLCKRMLLASFYFEHVFYCDSQLLCTCMSWRSLGQITWLAVYHLLCESAHTYSSCLVAQLNCVTEPLHFNSRTWVWLADFLYLTPAQGNIGRPFCYTRWSEEWVKCGGLRRMLSRIKGCEETEVKHSAAREAVCSSVALHTVSAICSQRWVGSGMQLRNTIGFPSVSHLQSIHNTSYKYFCFYWS